MLQSNNKRLLTYTSLILVFIIFILVNIVSNIFFKSIRFDFTQQKIYTLSLGSKKILTEIKEPINIKFYFSRQLAQSSPYLISYASRVRELLLQYQQVSKDKINVHIIDPEPFSETEDQAVNEGLHGVPMDGQGNELYFGLVATNSLINKEIIPFLQPNREAYLEYDISQMIYKLIHPTATKIALLSDLPLAGNEELYFMQGNNDAYPWAIWNQLKQSFAIKVITNDSKQIADDIKLLMMVITKEISQDTAYMIDQFVMRGGHILAFIAPNVQFNHQGKVPAKQAVNKQGNLPKLLRSWGVSIPAKIFASVNIAKKIKYNQHAKEYIVNYPIWIDVSKKYFASNDMLTSNLQQLTFASTGIIEKVNSSATKMIRLISSDGDNMLIEAAKLDYYREHPDKLLNDYIADHKKYTLAARISGKIKSAFPEGLHVNKKHIKVVKDSNIILLACTDMLRDNFWVNVQNFLGNRLYIPTSSNGSFVLSALDNLTGSNSLISIRNRGIFSRPFTTIQNLQSKTRLKFKIKENALMQNLEHTKQKLVELEQRKKESNSIALSVRQKKEEEKFRKELVVTRQQLREVQRELNKDIEKLALIIRLINIVLMPLLVFLGGAVFWLCRIRTNKDKSIQLLYRAMN